MRFEVANELEALREIPTIETERLTLTELRDEGTLTTPSALTTSATAGGGTTIARIWWVS